jgi:hypothetical protein
LAQDRAQEKLVGAGVARAREAPGDAAGHEHKDALNRGAWSAAAYTAAVARMATEGDRSLADRTTVLARLKVVPIDEAAKNRSELRGAPDFHAGDERLA